MYTPYTEWLSAISRNLLQEEGTALPPELTLQSHWYEGGFGLEFTTTTGEKVEVKYLGEWNRSSGPDFKECIITIDGEEQKGDIELDPRPADWENHGHATNPAFDKVILHVSFSDHDKVAYCRTSDQREVPQVHISEIAEGLVKLEAHNLPGFCADEFSLWSASEVDQLLRASARHRLSKKAERLSRQIKAVGLNETLWQALATTLGYRPNSQSMRLLSQRIKAHQIKNLGDKNARLAVLLGTSCFLHPDFYKSSPSETQEYLKSLWENWWRERRAFELSEERQIAWKMHGQRPVNHPHRRVASLALLWPSLEKISTAVKAPNTQRLKELEKALISLEDDFWSHHYTLTSKRSERKLSLFGKDKFRELVSNFIIPIWYLADQEAAFDYFSSLRSTTKNEQVKRSLERLFAKHSSAEDLAKFTYQHQGLQQLYHDFCLRHGCLQCPFPRL